jgi:hypothetical protein
MNPIAVTIKRGRIVYERGFVAGMESGGAE